MLFTLPGYAIQNQIYEGQHSKVFRGFRIVDNKPVVLKLLKAERPSEEQLAAFQYEYDLVKLLNQEGTVEVYGIEKYQYSMVIILEDFYPLSLQEVLVERRLSFKEALNLSLGIIKSLEKIHKHKIIHKDISPSNILWNIETSEVKLIDFGLATQLAKENPQIVPPHLLEGTLYYISPEQTGRMNRTIDYRSDFYSLGVIFYHLFTGILPFDCNEPMEIVHAHIAKVPKPPIKVDPMVPAIISNLIMRLLAKSAEDRYQSIAGIKADLQQCLDQFQGLGIVNDFTLGKFDYSQQFKIPEKLYGRADELSKLLNLFERINKGNIELALVSGYSGIGKSSLIHELYKPIVAKRGYFISGKYDQLKRNIPYAAIRQAIQDLIRQLLAEPEDKIAEYKKTLNENLGSNKNVLIELIPELELLLGKQNNIENYSNSNHKENETRLELAFKDFFKTFADQNKPLVIFLDDLQWVDLSSLNLLQSLLTHQVLKKILIIGAYRDNEIYLGHPLNLKLETIEKANVPITHLLLKPLSIQEVEELLSDTVHTSTGIKELAALCAQKTAGNPFFLHQFLQDLYEKSYIQFNVEQARWEWDLEIIKKHDSTENVIDLVIKKIKKLPHFSQEILQYAACLGNRFDLQTLSLVVERDSIEVAKSLWLAIQEGLIVPLDEAYNLVISHHHLNANYQFLHDKVQQAAYALLDNKNRDKTHLKIGRLLLKQTPIDKQEETLFSIVDHFNCGLSFISREEKPILSSLNFRAGVKAKKAIAYESALRYFQTAISLLPANAWQENYPFSLNLFNEAMENAYLLNQHALINQYAEVIKKNANSTIDQVKIYELRMFDTIFQNAHVKTTEIFLNITSKLGQKFNYKNSLLAIFIEIIRIKWISFFKNKDFLSHLPQIQNEKIKAVMRMANNTIAASYFTDPKLMVEIILKSFRLTIQYGKSEETAKTFCLYGSFLSGIRGDLEQGYQLGLLSLKMAEELPAANVKAYVIGNNYNFNIHWKEPLRNSLDKFLESYNYALVGGDLESQANSAFFICTNSYLAGLPLPKVSENLYKFTEVIHSQHHEATLNLMNLTSQIVENLSIPGPNPGILTGSYYNEEIAIKESEATHNTLSLGSIYFTKCVVNYFFNNYEESLKSALSLKKYIQSLAGSAHYRHAMFYQSLARLAVYSKASFLQKIGHLFQLYINQMRIKKWAKACPDNNLNKYYLVKAELCRVLGNFNKAALFYEKSIASANRYEYLQEEALAAELAFRFYYYQGEPTLRIAKVYLTDAIYLYKKWGAMAKVETLEKEYGGLISKATEPSLSQHTQTSGVYNLDLATVTKASQAIAKEIEFSDLLRKLMKIVIENAGGQKGYLLLEKNGEWIIESAIADNEITVSSMSPNNLMPLSILSYVIHTQKPVILDEASENNQFINDTYINQYKPKSILCIPLLNQGVLTGVLYLENNLVTGSFTKDRIEVLNLLSAQIVISISNARLYQTIMDTNQAYERFVPKEFLNFLSKKNIIDVQLGDQVKQEMTVMFCDIKNFTNRSEKMSPQENFNYINTILEFLEPIITQHGGFIDKYIGDGIMALYPKNAESALEASIAMLKSIALYNQKFPHQEPTYISIGLNTGELMLGIVGGKHRMQGSVISDAVNVAARIESLTRTYQSSLLISEATYERLRNPANFLLRKIDKVILKGKSKPITIFESFDTDDEDIILLKRKTKSLLEEAIQQLYVNNIQTAYSLFKKVIELDPNDMSAQIGLSHCHDKNREHDYKYLLN